MSTRLRLTPERDEAQRLLGNLLTLDNAAEARRTTVEAMTEAIEQGKIIAIRLSDGTVLVPVSQFGPRKRPKPQVVLAVQALFAAHEPTGTLAASWLLMQHSPYGFAWRDIAHLPATEEGIAALLAVARHDLHLVQERAQ